MNSNLENKKCYFELLIRKMKKQNLDFEVAQDIFIELKHYAIGFIIHELQNRVTKSIYAL